MTGRVEGQFSQSIHHSSEGRRRRRRRRRNSSPSLFHNITSLCIFLAQQTSGASFSFKPSARLIMSPSLALNMQHLYSTCVANCMMQESLQIKSKSTRRILPTNERIVHVLMDPSLFSLLFRVSCHETSEKFPPPSSLIYGDATTGCHCHPAHVQVCKQTP
jgi:hypothetical protein